MMGWWISLSQRERLLIAVAGILTMLFILFQFVAKPSWDSKDRAERGYANALEDWHAVQRAAGAGTKSGNFATSGMPLQTVVTNTADSYGLTITRLLPDESNNLNVWMDSVNSNTAFFWLKELETNHGIRVGQASLRQDTASDTVSLNVYLTRNL